MKKVLLTLLIFFTLTAQADEGMWMPSLLGQGRIKEMQKQGLKLTAEDLYSINKASLKDAIILFGGGCTGELISDKGLLLTNHHCGYGQIQEHSTVENDYLTNGFTAMNASQELPNPGLTVSFLEHMTDVTSQVLNGVTAQISEKERQQIIAMNREVIIKKITDGKKLSATIESLYYGNQYFLFTYKVYRDVRLVFAPASSIGKFGGDTDNWMWPRHTGDFSVFRIYADQNNEPAEYSTKNRPYVPKKSLEISIKGIKEGDFTFVYGYPARTTEYLYSGAVSYIQDRANPARIALRTARLEIMNREQAKDRGVRIQYASKNAGIANGWKKWQGELIGIKRLRTVEKKQQLEKQFIAWASDKPEYRGVVERFDSLYTQLEPYAYARDYYTETAFASELLVFANQFTDISKADPAKLDAAIDYFFKDYSLAIDQQSTTLLLEKLYDGIDKKYLPTIFLNANLRVFADSPNSPQTIADEIYKNSIFTNKAALKALLVGPDAQAKISQDPAFIVVQAFKEQLSKAVVPSLIQLNSEIELLYRTYMRGLMAMQADRQFYPDANFTLRIAYGKIDGFTPRDGVYYKPFSTLEGVMQKDNPDIYDYDVPQPLRDAYAQKNYGRWAVNGTVPLCFIASNHTSGGNSGSPVLNAHGQLIGLNFDRAWEGTMSDIEYDPTVCRNISLDVRYVLFIIDKIGGAGYLIDEMKLVK